MDGLDARQRELVERWLPGARVVADHAWGLLEGTVLEVEHAGERYVVKSGGPENHHIGREIEAHESGATAPLLEHGRASRLVAADREARILVTTWLDGRLADGTDLETDAKFHREAGRLLRLVHDQGEREDPTLSAQRIAGALAALDGVHRISEDRVRTARAVLAATSAGPVRVVPTHGDYQPRNWLDADSELRVIDWGRFAWRPAFTDLLALDHDLWRGRPGLEHAFLDGYAGDPRTEPEWSVERLVWAIGTASWALRVGDPEFEAAGLRALDSALAAL